MIFVCTGSQIYPFNRLIKELDRLVQTQAISQEVFAQIGESNPPAHFACERFLDRERFAQLQQGADLIISHAGTGALVGALKLGKQVIAVPRLAQFGEHIDDHQLQIAQVLSQEGYLRQVLDMDMLMPTIKEAMEKPIIKRFSSKAQVLSMVEAYLDETLVKGSR